MKALFQLFVVLLKNDLAPKYGVRPSVFFPRESTSHFGCFIIESTDTCKLERRKANEAYSSSNKCIGVRLFKLVAIALISLFRVCEKCFKS